MTLRENLSSFQDQAAISAYAVSALNWAVGEGLMQGTGDKLEPTGQRHPRAGRGDAAALHPAQFLNTKISAAVQLNCYPSRGQ